MLPPFFQVLDNSYYLRRSSEKIKSPTENLWESRVISYNPFTIHIGS
jgi:hypothetical protein